MKNKTINFLFLFLVIVVEPSFANPDFFEKLDVTSPTFGHPKKALLYNKSLFLLFEDGNGVRYDLDTQMWSDIAPIPTTRSDYSAALFEGGRILISGGVVPNINNPFNGNSTVSTSASEICNPSSDSFLVGYAKYVRHPAWP